MNRSGTDLRAPSFVHLARAGDAPPEPGQRLVVVLFETEDEALSARRIAELARRRESSVLLLGVAPDVTREARLRRRLATIAAFLRDQTNPVIPTTIRIEAGRDWIEGIRARLYQSDMLACYLEQTVGVLERPLCDVLSTNLNLPVYAFAGLREPRQQRESRLYQAASWLGSLASIVGFFLLQARIISVMQGWMQAVLLLLTLFAEVSLVWFLSSVLAQS